MRTFDNEWICQVFEDQPTFFTKRMFGGLAVYLFGRQMMVLVEPTKTEPGNVNYDLHQGVQDPAVFYFYENWESAEFLKQHSKSPLLQETIARAATELVDGEVTIATLRRIA